MQFIYDSVNENHKSTLAATSGLVHACLNTIEHFSRLHLDTTRAVVLRSSELALFYLTQRPSIEAISALNSAARTGIEAYTAYCRQLRSMARQAAPSPVPAG